MNRMYVFFTPAIGNVGGTQLFVKNKATYLRTIGWEVTVIYFQYFKILIEELKEYESGYVSDLRYGVQYMSKRLRKKVVDEIARKIGPYDTIVIESHMFRLAFWAELVAKSLNCVHVLAPLEEDPPMYRKVFADFLDFKLRRYECLNASEEALKRFLGPFYNSDYDTYIHQIDAYCSNVSDNTCNNPIILDKADFVLMSVGRLEKPYIIPMFEEVKAFSAIKKDKIINVLIIGASPNGDKEVLIKSMFCDVNNVNLYFLGFLYPIPTSYLDVVDVGIASANSILVMADYGIPTIAVDWHDFQAMGIYGKTTKNLFHRTVEPIIKISSLLEEVFSHIDRYKNKSKITYSNKSLEEVFENQLSFLEKSSKEHKYFDVTTIFGWKEYCFCNMKRIVHRILCN